MKKFLSLLLVAAMLLSMAPTFVIAAEASTTEVKLYDLHITGNVVVGGTLTANFEPADADAAEACGLDLKNTKATITWYLRNRMGNGNGNKSLGATGETYTIPDDWKSLDIVKNAANPSIYFTVTPKDGDNNTIGSTVYYSAVTYFPEAVNSAADDKPVAYNATIVPQNSEGSINIGDTVAARFSFRYVKDKTIANGSSKYTWYTSDTMLANADINAENAKVVQAESTSPYYTIKAADAGKWLYAKVVPVSLNSSVGDAIYTKNHLGNAFLDSEVIANGTTSPTALRPSTYPQILLLADGTSVTDSNDASTYVYSSTNTKNTTRKLIVNAGKNVSFDTLHFKHNLSNVKNLVIGYSADNVNWTIVKSDGSTLSPKPYEIDCGGVKSAQYFKVELVNTDTKYVMIDEFYPFLKNDAWFEGYTDSKIASFSDNIITVQSLNVSLADLHKKENGFTLKSDYDAEGSSVNADKIIESGISYVTKLVTSDGDVYKPIENPQNVYVTEDIENTYMKITGINGVSQYIEISVDAKVTTSIDYTNAMFATLTDNVIKVKAWGTPLAELHKKANGFVLTSNDDAEGSSVNADKIIGSGISYVTKSVTSDGDVYTTIENPETVYVTENTENTFMKITGINGVSQYIEIEHAGGIVQKATEGELTGSSHSATSRYPLGTVYFPTGNFNENGYAKGKYLIKTQIYLPEGYRVTFHIKQAGTAQTEDLAIKNLAFFMGHSNPYTISDVTYRQCDIGVPGAKLNTEYNYRLDKWYDFEYLLDYDKLDYENKTISVSAWIDGVKVADEVDVPWVDPATITNGAKNRISPYFRSYPQEGATGIKYKNSSFRQVWSADTHVVENDYSLSIDKVNDDSTTTEAKELVAGNYTANTNMKVHTGTGLYTYIAKYYVSNGVKELAGYKAVRDITEDYIEVTQADLANNVELKAITFSNLTDGLYPQFVAETLK